MCADRWLWIKETLSYDSNLWTKKILEKSIIYSQERIAKA